MEESADEALQTKSVQDRGPHPPTEAEGDGWFTVKSRSEKKHEKNSEYYARKKPTFTGIRGVRKADSGNFKAAERVSDLFLRGVNIDASKESVIDYVLNTFNVNMINI